MNKPLRFVVGAAVLCAGMWAFSGDDASDEAQASRHFANHAWVNRMPKDARDMIIHLVPMESSHGRFGVVGKASRWRVFADGFRWKKQGDDVGMVFPQERARGRYKVKTWRCEGDAPSGFDLCLELRQGDRKARFYSREEWRIEPHDVDEAQLEALPGWPGLASHLDAEHELAHAGASHDVELPQDAPEPSDHWLWE